MDGRPKCEGAIHEIEQNRGREAEMREVIHENGENRGREAEIREVIHENGRYRGWGTVYFTDQEPSPSVQAPSATV